MCDIQAMAVYGQLTGKPKDDPPPQLPPSGLPDSTPEDQGPSDDGTKPGGDVSSMKSKTSVSGTNVFREVEGSKDSHMKWNPPASGFRKPGSPSTVHFTAATSPTRSRDFS